MVTLARYYRKTLNTAYQRLFAAFTAAKFNRIESEDQ
ncbi:hypothetical protein SAMN06269173_11235 [Hymenobacter mucosus]|uniref:Uncharacterized protein n=1 Tax=Hymenobacter mucosus TaxID=1411120 RepID=A0A239AFM2_9BACT|nr:hypothetical protein SAMN06269173_11235 [Hymenobacter mucosus]